MAMTNCTRPTARTLRRMLFLCALLAVPAYAQPVLQTTLIASNAKDFSEPHDAAFSPDGKLLFVTDMRNSRMRVLDANTLADVAVFGAGELSYPHDAVFDRDGRLLVADTGNDRVAIYTITGAQARLSGELKDGLSGPEGVAVAPDGSVWVSNTRGANVTVFRDGRRVASHGRYGSKPGEFSRPHDIEVDSRGSVYVVDSGNHRIQVFDAQFRYLATLGGTDGIRLKEPKYAELDASGRMLIADEYNDRILVLDAQRRPAGQIGTGKRGDGAGELNKPEGVLARWPLVWVIDTHNDRILLVRIRD